MQERWYINRWSIFSLFSVLYLLLYFHRVCPAVLAPEFVRDFSVSGVSLGILTSAYFYPYALMQLPVGILSDKWGPRRTATAFGVIAALGSVFLGLSPNLNVAVLSRALLGLGVSAVFIPAMTVFGTWFTKEEYARVSGAFMAIGTVGWFLGTAPLAFLSEAIGWRGIFIAIGAITAGFTVLTWLMVRDRPRSEKPSSATAVRQNSKEDKGKYGLGIIIGEKSFCYVALWFFLRVGILFSFFGLWAGPYLMDAYGCSKVRAGNILSMAPLAIIIGSPLFGYLSDKLASSRKKVLVGSSILHSLCWLIMLLFIDSLPIPVLYVIFFVMGMMAGAPASTGFSLAKELFPPALAGTCIGMANLAGFLGGAVFQPIVGYVLDGAGRVNGVYPVFAYRLVFQMLFVMSVAALVGTMLTKETLHRKLKGRTEPAQ